MIRRSWRPGWPGGRRPRIRRWLAVGLFLVVVGGGYAAFAGREGAPAYRTAVAKQGDVERTLDLTGSLEPAGRSDLSFATAGTVESVSVAAGDSVEAGEVLRGSDRSAVGPRHPHHHIRRGDRTTRRLRWHG